MSLREIGRVPVNPESGAVYEHGWQSWSPSESYSLGMSPPRPLSEHRRVTNWRPESALPTTLRREFAAEGIEVWEFEVLLALHRAPGQRLSAGALLRGSQVTAGAITNRVARLEKQGWVRRDIDPADRRQVLVTLTPAGQRHAEKILALNTTAEQRLLGQADPAAILRMSEDLRNLLLAIEGPALDEHPYEACSVPRH